MSPWRKERRVAEGNTVQVCSYEFPGEAESKNKLQRCRWRLRDRLVGLQSDCKVEQKREVSHGSAGHESPSPVEHTVGRS